MAGDWIKMRTNLDTDPAVVRISSGLKLDRFATVGRLHRIWSWANEHLTDGQDVPIDSAFLDQLVDCSGFAEAMRHVGWLSGRDGSLCFPSFDRHNGASAKARALDAMRKKESRKSSEKCPDVNRTQTGLEKRREEESITLSKERVRVSDLGEWKIPSKVDSPRVRELLQQFEAMRKRIRKPIRDRVAASLPFKRFDSAEHLEFALETCISNDYQGLKPEYRPTERRPEIFNGSNPRISTKVRA